MTDARIREHKAIQRYLDEVCEQIRAKEMHEEIRLELTGHLEELAYEKLELAGQDDDSLGKNSPTDDAVEEAIGHAITRMGNPQTIGKRLHRVHRPKTDWGLLALAALLIGIGLMAMYALQELADPDNAVSWFPLLSNKLRFVAIGAAVLLVLYFVDYRKLKTLRWPIYAVAAGLFILARIGPIGIQMNGAYSWIIIGGIALDVSAIAPYLFLIAYAGYLASEKPASASMVGKLREYGKELGLFFAMPAYLYLLAPSLVSLAVHFVGASVLLLTRKQGWKRLLFYGTFFFSVLAFVIFAARGFTFNGASGSIMYQRWLNYLHLLVGDKSAEPLPSREFIRSAGLWGHGFGRRLEGLIYPYSENVVAYLVGSLGWAFGIGLAALVAAFVYRSVRIANQSMDPFARLLVIALSSVLAVKLVWTLLMSVGLLPFVSMAMPFIGYSGLQTVIEMAALGLLLSAFRRKDSIPLPRRERIEQAAPQR